MNYLVKYDDKYSIFNLYKVKNMQLKLGDIVVMKKAHPCGSKEFEITRLGVDYRLRCTGCGREVMIPRIKADKSIKVVKSNEK